MNKADILKILTDTSENLRNIIDSANHTISLADGRSPNIKKINNKTVFYLRTKEGKQLYVKPTDTRQIEELASVYYAKKIKDAALNEKKQIDNCLAILKKDPDTSEIDKVDATLPKEIMKNAVITELANEGYARKWQDGNSIVRKWRTHSKDDYHIYKTMRGDYVASKSEVMIADRLFVKGIPYHYEIAFTPEVEEDKGKPIYDYFGRLAGYEVINSNPQDADTLHPDFYVLNKRTRKAYFWEHLGKMDDPEYCRKNFNRFMRILDSGYTIGEDLIVTHEDSRHPLMTESIDEIVKRYLT